MWEFNYGEWTEAYVFLKLLSEGKIYAADADFHRDENVYIDISKIIRHEKENHILEFERMDESSEVEARDNGSVFRMIAYMEFARKARQLYDEMRNVTTSDRKFPVPVIEEYLSELRFSQPKVPKLPADVALQYGDKTDIIVTMEDSNDHAVTTNGFSIKSHMSNPSTLFNSALSSKLIYEIVGCTQEIMDEINANQIDSEIGMFKYIKDNPNLSLCYVKTSDEFKDNLDMLELTMDRLFSEAMLIQIGYYERANSNDTRDIIEKVADNNPLGVRRPNVWYATKMKDFLYASFSGLTASNPWDGVRRLSGGYIDVNSNGEMLYYRAVSDDIFCTYLYEHTYFDRPSRGVMKDIAKLRATASMEGRVATEEEVHAISYKPNGEKKPKKGDWGYVYYENNKYYIAINFQIRFR